MREPVLDAATLQRSLQRIAHEIVERNPDDGRLVLVGIQKGGVPVARRLAGILAGILGREVPCGAIDVTFHRDDLDRRAAPVIYPTEIPGDINGCTVVLVDDVLFTGRTIRAALDALHEFGRPRRVQLAVVVDRGHRELPIKADFVGKNIPTRNNQTVDVCLSEADGVDGVFLSGDPVAA
jgi:pyrimidine operon attenuation protein / uracil phosphoribosyltransferase